MTDDNLSPKRGSDQIIRRYYLEGVTEISGTAWSNISRETDFMCRLYKCPKYGHEKWVSYPAVAKG